MSRKTRQLIWSVPLIAAVAVIGALALLMTLEPNAAQADHVDLPGSATGLEATAESRTSIELTWTAPASDNVVGNAIGGAPTGYRIDQSDDNRVWEQLVVNTGNTLTSRTLRDNISTSTQRHYRVFAINEAGTGPVSNNPVTAFVRVADDYPAVAPSRFTLTLSVQGPNQINLSWTEPTDNGGQKIIGYQVVEMVPDSGAEADDPNVPCNDAANCLLITAADQSTKRTAKADGLNAGSTHYYRVIAMNGIGSGTPSDVKGATTTQPTAPSRPGEPVAVPGSTGSDGTRTIDLYWTEPASNGGHMLADHVIEARVRVRTSADDVTPVTWTDWTDWKVLGQTGSTTLRDASGSGLTAISAVDVTRGSGDPGTVDSPSMAYNARLSQAEDGEYKFRMRAEQDNDPAGKGLNLKSAWANFNGGREITVPAASPTLQAGNNLPLRTNTEAIVPLMPDLTAKSLDVESVRRQGIGLTWKASDGLDMVVGPSDHDEDDETAMVNDDGPTPSDYRIDFIDVSDDADPSGWQLGQTRTVSLSQWQHQGLTSGDGRIYRLFPINGNVFGEAAIAADTVDPANVANPDQVLNLRQTGKTTTSITMGWGSLSSAATYDLSYAPVPDDGSAPDSGTWMTLKEGLTTTSYTDSMGLNPGDQRWYRIVAKTDKGGVVPGTGGAEALGETDEAGEPGKPVGLVAEVAKDSSFTATTDRGVLLLWDEPLDEGKDPETSYRVQRMVNGGAWETILEDTKSLDNQTALSTHYNDEEEPAMDEMRAYRVAALSGNGLGPWSNVAYIPAQDHVPPTLTAPAMVDATVSGSMVTVTWEDGAGADKFTIAMFRRNADGSVDVANAVWQTGVTASPYTVDMESRPADTYVVAVAAGQDDDSGGTTWSDWATGSVVY